VRLSLPEGNKMIAFLKALKSRADGLPDAEMNREPSPATPISLQRCNLGEHNRPICVAAAAECPLRVTLRNETLKKIDGTQSASPAAGGSHVENDHYGAECRAGVRVARLCRTGHTIHEIDPGEARACASNHEIADHSNAVTGTSEARHKKAQETSQETRRVKDGCPKRFGID
jgi:hypothetical protein